MKEEITMKHEAPIKGMTAEGMELLLEFIDLIKQLSDEDKRTLLRMKEELLNQQEKAKA